MSDKQKKFEPTIGWINAINHERLSVLQLATALNLDTIVTAKALDEAGYTLSPDIFNISNDVAKLLEYERKQENGGKPDLKVAPTMADVADSVSELDEEEMANE